ncbi:putative long-chain-alcohol O-fatty-acyltransferase [Rosa chinensis]|uniref:Putative long-chain-alcohol O-fatty-acyltransferase n=1 Tax=Rosa chinensis TaxID=74649 RepID=A0A2P6RF17_ROSCH|nr:putative long-chain-alcohol O-fatty-acyltransferase [Rosa chinensis]
MYLGLEIFFPLIVTSARTVFGLELEPQSNKPYLSTSLQDFWGYRWNLMVTNILRPTVYDLTRHVCARLVGERWPGHALCFDGHLCSLRVNARGYLLLSHARAAHMGSDVDVKKAVTSRWRLHSVVSGLLTFVFLAVTGNWLFFPQLPGMVLIQGL